MTFDQSVALLAHAVPEVFVTMLSLQPTMQEAFESKSPLTTSEVTAMIALAGQQRGSVSIHTTREQAGAFTAILLGTPGAQVSDDEARDAMGEVINMIAGDVKQSLAKQTLGVEISLPTVVMGPALSVSVRGRHSAVVPFDSPQGRFFAEIVIEAAP
jgi:chemotaxis protein CheX